MVVDVQDVSLEGGYGDSSSVSSSSSSSSASSSEVTPCWASSSWARLWPWPWPCPFTTCTPFAGAAGPSKGTAVWATFCGTGPGSTTTSAAELVWSSGRGCPSSPGGGSSFSLASPG